ncbi:MAG: thioesterase family protein [Alphaproteobacteria bacterium]
MARDTGPLELHQDKVAPEWIDYNGHMNIAYYVLAFDRATDAFFKHVGALHEYREQHGQALFTLELHVTYERELVVDAPIRFTTQVLGLDHKRLHLFHAMYHADEGYLAATNDMLLINVDIARRRSAPIRPEVYAALDRVWSAQRRLAVPPQAGRKVSIGGGRPATPA